MTIDRSMGGKPPLYHAAPLLARTAAGRETSRPASVDLGLSQSSTRFAPEMGLKSSRRPFTVRALSSCGWGRFHSTFLQSAPPNWRSVPARTRAGKCRIFWRTTARTVQPTRSSDAKDQVRYAVRVGVGSLSTLESTPKTAEPATATFAEPGHPTGTQQTTQLLFSQCGRSILLGTGPPATHQGTLVPRPKSGSRLLDRQMLDVDRPGSRP